MHFLENCKIAEHPAHIHELRFLLIMLYVWRTTLQPFQQLVSPPLMGGDQGKGDQ
jgi:hypothetical protein